MTDRELLQQALVWLDDKEGEYTDEFQNFIDVIRTRLAPPKKEWVGLTDEEKLIAYSMYEQMGSIGFVQAIEAKLKDKNT
jgi:hypothetical protein